MIVRWVSRFRYHAVAVACMFLAGCAARLPSSFPITGETRTAVLKEYLFFQQRCYSTPPIDADISLEIEGFGRHFRASGMLQIQPPSSLRTTILDQVGRPLFIMIADGQSLTLVNSMKGEALIGTIASITRESSEYLDLGSEEVVRLLTGRYAPSLNTIVDVRRERQAGDYYAWLIFPAAEENRHNILFDPSANRIMRHVLSDESGDILLDIRYSWGEEKRGGCALPSALLMSGASLGGEVTLGYEQVIPQPAIPENTFHLTLPDHYNVRRIE